jgi:hypothetical protein
VQVQSDQASLKPAQSNLHPESILWNGHHVLVVSNPDSVKP